MLPMTLARGAASMSSPDTPVQWGWVRYSRTSWIDRAGRRLYVGVFRADHDPSHYTDTHIRFWAHHPIRALRSICREPRSSRALLALDLATIN